MSNTLTRTVHYTIGFKAESEVTSSCSTENILIERSPNHNDLIECTATNKIILLCTGYVQTLYIS